MSKVVDSLLYVDSHDSVMRVLQSWRLWVVGALVGTLIATGLYFVVPPLYRARGVVVVDHNIEDIYDIPPARQFYFMGRETRKLQELAWSDETMQILTEKVGGVSVSELRDEILSLSQPEDGGWYFYADHKDPAMAEKIAGAWAETFYQQVLDGVEISEYIVVIRAEINKLYAEDKGYSGGEARYLAEQMHPYLKESKGVSPYVEVTLSQSQNLEVKRLVPISVYILAGSFIGAFSLALTMIMMLKAEENDVFVAE
jgi:hypothetical protein